MQHTIIGRIIIQREVLQRQLDTISHLVRYKLTTQYQSLTRTANELRINQVHSSCFFLQDTIKLTHTHLTSQGNKLTLVRTQDVIRKIEQEILDQFRSKLSIVTTVRRSNLLQKTSRDINRTSICTHQRSRTILINITLRVNHHTLTSLRPFTHSLPLLIVRPQIRSLTSFRIFQSNPQYCRICGTSDIIIKTSSKQEVSHLEMSVIVQDITLFAVLFISRSQTRYLATRSKQFTRNIRVRLTISNKASVNPLVTILIRCTRYTYLIFSIIKFQDSTRTNIVFNTIR